MMQMAYPPSFFMPVYPQDIYYQNQPYIMQQQHQQQHMQFAPNSAPAVNMSSSSSSNSYNPRAKGNNNNKRYNNHGSNNGSFSNNNSHNNLAGSNGYSYVDSAGSSVASTTPTPNTNSPVVNKVTLSHSTESEKTGSPATATTVKLSEPKAVAIKPSSSNLLDKPSAIDSKSIDSVSVSASHSRSSSNNTALLKEQSYPLLINSSLGDFVAKQHSAVPCRKQLSKDKYDRLKNFKQQSTGGLLIKTNVIKIIDYNTNTSYLTNEKHNDEHDNDNSTNTTNDNAAHDDVQTDYDIKPREENLAPTTPPVALVSNWAAILQSSNTPVSTKKVKHTRSKSSVGSASAVVAPFPSSSESLSTTTLSSVTKFNMSNESVLPLGILILKIMYDPNYSVFGEDNELPVFKIAPRGLTNTGNICYMNSILQMLLYCVPFNRLLKLIEDKSIGTLNRASPTPLLDATIKFFNDFSDKTSGLSSEVEDASESAISPETFYMTLISHEKFLHLKWGQQEDAEEFLGYYLDGLHEEFLSEIRKLNTPSVDSLIQTFSNENENVEKVSMFKFNIKNTVKLIKNENKSSVESKDEDNDNEWNEVGSNNKKISVKRTVEIEPSPINMIFGGLFKSVLIVPKANNPNQFQKSITLDPFQNLQLDISEADTIEDAFLNMNKLEKISYKNNDKEVQLKKQTFIDRLPEVLIIHLKRFSYLKDKEVGIEKLRKKVDYAHDLHVPSEVLSNKNIISNAATSFKLIGVVYHHGSSAEGGHYTSDVLRSDTFNNNQKKSNVANDWLRIDDTTLKPISVDEVLNGGTEESIKNAYILLYERYN